jgi:hypothetical protein
LIDIFVLNTWKLQTLNFIDRFIINHCAF